MGKSEVKKIVKKYSEELVKNNFPFSAVYLFGSYAKGKQHNGSDIDVAVVSDKFYDDNDIDDLNMRRARRDVDVRIEPHGFSPKSFNNPANPMAYEILKTGIRIT